MAIVGPRPADDQLNLLTEWGDSFTRPRQERAGVLSVVAHAALIVLLLVLPSDLLVPPPEPEPPRKHEIVTPLVEPITEFTQKDATKGKVSHEIDVASLTPRPRIQAPQGPPPAPKGNTPKPMAALPPAPTPKAAAPAAALPEPPKIEVAEAPKLNLPPSSSTVTPPPPTVEKPKMELQNVGGPPPPVPPGQSKVAIPSGSVSDAIRNNMRSGTLGSGNAVGDAGAMPGIGESINQPPGPGIPGSSLQLKSDPMGVDFQPYLKQILVSIKTNWLAVYPESARLGRRGRVTLAFIVTKNGTVTKVTTSTQSGTEALDRAAIAAISASNPFPPLPSDFKGDRIVLEVNFVYNMPRR
jgi:TonB family protein